MAAFGSRGQWGSCRNSHLAPFGSSQSAVSRYEAITSVVIVILSPVFFLFQFCWRTEGSVVIIDADLNFVSSLGKSFFGMNIYIFELGF